MTRTALLATIGAWIAGSVVCLAQQAPAPPMLPEPETAPMPQVVEPRLVPMAPSIPAPQGGLTDGAGLTPLAVAAPVGAIPGADKHGGCHGCFNHKLWRFFTYCPVKGCCGKTCSCCCPPPYTFFFCTPIPTTRINTPLYVGMFPATLGPLPQRTPLTPDSASLTPASAPAVH